MTEGEWLAADDPDPLWDFFRGKASARKLRLFAVACCRRIDHLLTDSRSKTALEFLETHADSGHKRRKGLAPLCEAAIAATEGATLNTSQAASAAVQWAITLGGAEASEYAAAEARKAAAWEVRDTCFSGGRPAAYEGIYQSASVPDAFRTRERWEQARLLRCLIGNPFRPVLADPTWLTSTVIALARGIYAERAGDRLPVLADALEEAGCDNADVLSHCREEGHPHVRGCWVVDLVLGKT